MLSDRLIQPPYLIIGAYMYKIAFKMLIGDRGQVSSFGLCAFIFRASHDASMLGIFWTHAMEHGDFRKCSGPIWVADPLVEQPGEFLPLLQTDLPRVRSIEGVKWAVPLFSSIQQARLDDGAFKSIQLMGLDTATQLELPQECLRVLSKTSGRTAALLSTRSACVI